MRKLTKEQEQEIYTRHKLDNSKESIASMMQEYNITKKAIYDCIKRVEKEGNSITQYKHDYTKKLDIIIETALKKLENQILNEDIKAKDLSTIIGIMYDKIRLEEGLSTENKAIQINIKVEK